MRDRILQRLLEKPELLDELVRRLESDDIVEEQGNPVPKLDSK